MRKLSRRLLLRWLVVVVIALVGATTRKTWINRSILESFQSGKQSFILGMWHNNILYFTYLLRELALTAMVSRSRDGEEIAGVIGAYGIKTARGSSSSGGAGALRGLARLLAAGGNVAINPDGPRGPRYELQKGIISLARLGGAPIIPIAFAGKHMIEFGSWDRMKLPRPFSRVVIYVGSPIWVERKLEDEEPIRLQVEQAMRQAVVIADRFAGGDLTGREPLLQEMS